jgi:hypothetical protein
MQKNLAKSYIADDVNKTIYYKIDLITIIN